MNEIEMSEGENYYWFGLGSVGFLTLGKDTGFIFADTITQAMERIRQVYPNGVVSVRKAIYGEWECDNFSNSGHLPHE